jgi:chromosome segregation ATPase
VDTALDGLRREDQVLAERERLAGEVVHRLEEAVQGRQEDARRLELLGERVELYRAERQRLEDTAARMEEALEDLRGRLEKEEQRASRLDGNIQGCASRLDALQQQLQEYRDLVVQQFLKVTGTEERLRRHQIEELEREIKELRKHAARLAEE